MVPQNITLNNSQPIELHHTVEFKKEPSPPKDPTMERVREVAGKVLLGLGLTLAVGALLCLAGHVIGMAVGSAAILAALMIIGLNAAEWGYNMVSNQSQKGLSMKLEFKVPEFAFPAA